MSIVATALYTLVGEELGIISGNMPLDPGDADKISRRHTSARAWLIEEGYCYWPANTIPDAVSLAFAQVIAGQCADLFGRGPRSEDPYAMGPAGMEAIKQHCSKRSSKEPTVAEYF